MRFEAMSVEISIHAVCFEPPLEMLLTRPQAENHTETPKPSLKPVNENDQRPENLGDKTDMFLQAVCCFKCKLWFLSFFNSLEYLGEYYVLEMKTS